MFYRLALQDERDLAKAVAYRAFARQASLDKNCDTSYVKTTHTEAQTALTSVAKAIYPWEDWSTLSESSEQELREEAPGLIAEWYRVFEPENYQQYLDEMDSANKDHA